MALCSVLLVGCNDVSTAGEHQTSTEVAVSGAKTHKVGEEKAMAHTINLTIGGQEFSVRLENNPTSQAFKEEFPLTLTMKELNGNEKYGQLTKRLPSNDEKPGQIHAGDLMLYGSDCVVLFYKDFPTSYSYTRLGHMEHPENLKDLVGEGDIAVTFAP